MALVDQLKSLSPDLLWVMDHATGAAKDVSGNGLHASSFGTTTPQYAPVLPGLTKGMRTLQSGAAVTNGNGIAAASTPSVDAATAVTWMMWGILNATPTTAAMVLGRRKVAVTSGGSGGMFYVATDRSLTFYLLKNGTNPENYCGIQTSSGVAWLWPLNQLTTIAVTMDTANLTEFYLNGVPIGFDYWSDSVTHVGYVMSANVTKRGNGGDNFMAGGGGVDTFGSPDMTYGPVASWSRALSADEIKALTDESLRGAVVL